MKGYERRETGRLFLPLVPVYARIDGRSFSNFTRGMKRPYDPDMMEAMQETTRWLVEQTGALIGYTQSDEISLMFYSPTVASQIFFNGRIFKLTSSLAAMATAKFLEQAMAKWPGRVAQRLPTFDCRVFQPPTLEEGANAILWRVRDATKNAISMLAQAHFSHRQLQGKSGSEMQEMLFSTHGINFNDCSPFFKEGTFFQRRRVLRTLSPEELDKIPPKFRPEGPVERTQVVRLDMPPFSRVTNRVDVIFHGADPKVAA